MKTVNLTPLDFLSINGGGIIEGTCDPIHEKIMKAIKEGLGNGG